MRPIRPPSAADSLGRNGTRPAQSVAYWRRPPPGRAAEQPAVPEEDRVDNDRTFGVTAWIIALTIAVVAPLALVFYLVL